MWFGVETTFSITNKIAERGQNTDTYMYVCVTEWCYMEPFVVQLAVGGDRRSLYCIRQSCTAVQTSGHWDIVQSTSDGYRSMTPVQMTLSTALHISHDTVNRYHQQTFLLNFINFVYLFKGYTIKTKRSCNYASLCSTVGPQKVDLKLPKRSQK